ncbi:unnamed protein product [Anisakis simplex]|uniref:Uncharacterized protein n=1 Tax=Anisakis simplex TaxID=6269 RepID=A0A3P6PGK2_ANISI|nr:unnamed protein product [Anisakis simplex]
MPWTPRYDKFLLHNVSKLNRVVDHQRYIAIISNFLDTHKTLRYDHNRQEIKVGLFDVLFEWFCWVNGDGIISVRTFHITKE